MKRLGMILVGSLTTVALTATAALAQYPPSKPPATIPDDPRPPVAFTGANISLGMIILVALLIVGTVLLLATRRRKVANSK